MIKLIFVFFTMLGFINTAFADQEVTYQCSMSDVVNNTGPCKCLAIQMTPPLCPRLEGIKLPCVVKLAASTCTYTIPGGGGGGSCGGTCMRDVCSVALVEEKYDVTFNGACTEYGPKYDCSIHSQGACKKYDESGVCTAYEDIVTPRECADCTKYEQITETRTRMVCPAGQTVQEPIPDCVPCP